MLKIIQSIRKVQPPVGNTHGARNRPRLSKGELMDLCNAEKACPYCGQEHYGYCAEEKTRFPDK
jgi:hypothetical protein